MQGLRAVALAVLLAMPVAPAALAADLGTGRGRAVAERRPVFEAPFTWTGLYIGAHGGYGWSDIDGQGAESQDS